MIISSFQRFRCRAYLAVLCAAPFFSAIRNLARIEQLCLDVTLPLLMEL